jgi:DNA-directed RNA polymerase subunit RPC12/RpoP
MSYTINWSRCPYCHKTLSVNFQQGRRFKEKIGQPAYYKCPNCQQEIWNGLKEWPDLNGYEKFIEIFKHTISVLIAGPAIGFMISFFVLGLLFRMIENSLTAVIIIAIIISGIIMLLSFIGFIREVKESSDRYYNKK